MDNQQKIYVTQEGYDQYIAALQESKRKYSEYLRTRSEYGKNTVENYQTGVYDTEIALLRNSVKSLEESISRLVVVESEKSDEGKIGLGDIVTVLHVDNNEVRVVKLSGGMPVLGLDGEVNTITINSPMGKAIYKKNVGDTVSFSVGKNTFSVNILSKEKSLDAPEVEQERQ